jgi:hypothetical protein
LESKIFYDKIETLEKNIQTIRRATADNFNTQLTTDNYIEKYLPFATQIQISDNILSAIARPLQERRQKLTNLTPLE